jgi:hypothetical protein
MADGSGVFVEAHDISVPIDAVSLRQSSARYINRGENALPKQKAVGRLIRIGVKADDISLWVDTKSPGTQGAGKVNGGEDALPEQKAVKAASAVGVASNDLSLWIDTPGSCCRRPRYVNRSDGKRERQKRRYKQAAREER